MKYLTLPDEQLILCLCQNCGEAFEELYRRSFEYGKVASRSLESSFAIPYHDYAEFSSAVSNAFFNAINGYIIGSSPFVYYFNSIFINQYRLSLVRMSNLCHKTCSIDSPIPNAEGLTYIDLIPDSNSFDSQYLTQSNLAIESLNESCTNSFSLLRERMVIAYRLVGCTYDEIA